MIEASGLTKHYGSTVAVDGLSFTVPPGQVTGFLGPNGAGKSTTMRLILGLDSPDAGAVTVNGRPYQQYRLPLFQAGALLDEPVNGLDPRRRGMDPCQPPGPVQLALIGLHLSQIAIGVLGVLIITSEYTSGMIRATLTAVPQRRLVLAAKTAVLATAAAAAGLATCYAAWFVFTVFLPASSPMRMSLSDPGVARAVTGAGLYLAVLALAGLGLGAVIRSSAGAITALFGPLLIPPIIMQLLPSSWQDTAGPYLPMNAAEAVYRVPPARTCSPPGPGSACSAATPPRRSPPASSSSPAATHSRAEPDPAHDAFRHSRRHGRPAAHPGHAQHPAGELRQPRAPDHHLAAHLDQTG